MKYVHEVSINFDLEYIKELALRQITTPPPTGLATHQRYVSDDAYLSSIRKEYPILGNVYNVYYLRSESNIEPHIDSDRRAALNFPIRGTHNTSTIFYKTTEAHSQYRDRFIYDAIIDAGLEEDYRFCLTKPTIINTTHIHSVENTLDKSRVILSWSILPQYSFEDAVEQLIPKWYIV